MAWIGRWRLFVALGVVLLAAGAVVAAYVARVRPQFPLVYGTPYAIAIGDDGCPVVPQHVPFVDSPGQFVAPDPSEVVLCTWVDTDADGRPEPPGTESDGFDVPPRQRPLTGQAAAEFAGLLNQLPDRNGAWRDWQRRHSGIWPDAPWQNGSWDANAECVDNLLLPARTFAFVLRYPGRDAVPIISSCQGWTDGTRTRIPIAYTPPSLTDQFIALYESHP